MNELRQYEVISMDQRKNHESSDVGTDGGYVTVGPEALENKYVDVRHPQPSQTQRRAVDADYVNIKY